jgi:cystathionine beta-lyase/cystathionine gamma-synthase
VSEKGVGTRAVHGTRRAGTGPLAEPVYQSSTFAFASAAEMRRYLDGDEELYIYTRYANPTLRALEEGLAALEGGEAAVVFASGMAAATTGLLSLLRAGDEVIACSSLYGGTAHLLRDVLPVFGITARFVPVAELLGLSRIAGPKSRVVLLESPTNPCLELVDIAAVAAAAHESGLVVLVDNTFATPVLQRPLELGADLVMHSLTKALAGHSDLIGGALVGSQARIAKAREMLKILGGCMDPHPAFLALRGLKTLHLRVERQCQNALALARHLAAAEKVTRVLYPGLASHPGHDVARRQMTGFGGVVTFALPGGLPAAERFYDGLGLLARAASLGGVESLVSLPVLTSHHGFTGEQLEAAGVDPGMVRVSLGVEDASDILDDVDRALAVV